MRRGFAKFFLWLLGCLACFEEARASSEVFTFVLGTDRGYIIPTLVTLHSLLKSGVRDLQQIQIIILANNLLKSEKEMIKMFVSKRHKYTTDGKECCVQVYFLDIGEDNALWKKNLGNVEQKIQFSISKLNNDECGKMLKYKATLPFYFGIVNLNDGRMFLEKTEKNKIEHYMWLDSDVLIVSDISRIYKECITQNVNFGSVNYYFLRKDLIKISTKGFDDFCGGFGRINPRNFSDTNMPYTLSTTEPCKVQKWERVLWRSSGGVLFFRTPQIGTEDVNIRNMTFSKTVEDDEQFFDKYFLNGNNIYVFSPRYNCRPSLPLAAAEFIKQFKNTLTNKNLNNEKLHAIKMETIKEETSLSDDSESPNSGHFESDDNNRNSLTEKLSIPMKSSTQINGNTRNDINRYCDIETMRSVESRKELQKIANKEDIAVWHWDRMLKPWHKLYGSIPKDLSISSNYNHLLPEDCLWFTEYIQVLAQLHQLSLRSDTSPELKKCISTLIQNFIESNKGEEELKGEDLAHKDAFKKFKESLSEFTRLFEVPSVNELLLRSSKLRSSVENHNLIPKNYIEQPKENE